jgi:ProP effector
MTISRAKIDAALAVLAGRFPQTFTPEKFKPHRPLKVGIADDIRGRYPELIDPHVLIAALSFYVRRVAYMRSVVAGAARIDLDGNPAGEVSPSEAEHAAARLVKVLAERGVHKAAVQIPAATPAPKPAVVVKPLKGKPVLRLPAFSRTG